MNKKIGSLLKVPIRDLWQDEAQDFTPWLAEDTQMQILSETIGIDLELENTEVMIGNYRADIIARDTSTNDVVIIENQLENTNHDHLGKIITYASGLNAKTVIWISQSVSEDHRKAIDWLNDITDDDISFFALEIELWKIDDSLPAPKFNIVCSPNEWAKTAKDSSKTIVFSETKNMQLDYWKSLKDYFSENDSFLSLRKPRAQQYFNIAIGHSKISVTLTVNTQSNTIGCEIYIRGDNAKTYFNTLKTDLNKIHEELGYALDWQELPDGKDCRIRLLHPGDIRNKAQWTQYFSWMKENAEKLHKVFSPRVKAMDC